MYKSKTDEHGNITRNEARLVVQEYAQGEGLDFGEASITRLESMRLLVSITCAKKFTLQHMDVKSAFLNYISQEEAYVEQANGFVNSEYLDYVYKLKKALYCLKQAPRAWYE